MYLNSKSKATFDFSQESLYLTVPAGSSVALNHTIGSVYDFSSFEPGTEFTITPRADSAIHESVNDAAPLIVESNAVEVTVESDLTFNHLFPGAADGLVPSVSTPRCSDARKRQLLVDALKYARSLAGGAATDIRFTQQVQSIRGILEATTKMTFGTTLTE
ncbi:hypothetical protein MPER_13619 [Moniliophthora perniciosa FA553]|nr:hypothetical protein MPER_13619 [Moniliophthora perniciosa FA553]